MFQVFLRRVLNRKVRKGYAMNEYQTIPCKLCEKLSATCGKTMFKEKKPKI